MKVKKNPISDKQMASIHVAYRQWAELLNEAGYSINKMIEQNLLHVDVPFTEENVKQIFGYLAIETLFPEKFPETDDEKKTKHPRLSTTETQLLFETLNANFANKFGVSIPFPEKKDEHDE